MHKYRVVEPQAEARLFTLRCSRGHYHVARALSLLPAVDARLEGDKPHLGFGLLVCPNSGAVYRVIFESIGIAESFIAPGAVTDARQRP